MIHALHFITQVRDGYGKKYASVSTYDLWPFDPDGHGPAFHREAKRISRLAKLNITVSHK